MCERSCGAQLACGLAALVSYNQLTLGTRRADSAKQYHRNKDAESPWVILELVQKYLITLLLYRPPFPVSFPLVLVA